MAQPKKKTPITKKATISDLKAKMGFGVKVENGTIEGASNADKQMEWLLMPKAFQNATKLPGFPCGYVTAICGHSNTGKSTLINHAIVAAQRQNTIPIIYDTENNFDFNYAIDMGLNAEPIYGDVEEEDPETGEIKMVNKIIEWKGDFFYFNSSILREMYGDIDYSTGKRTGKKRITAVIEDMAYSIKSFLEMQESGELPYNLLFVWDSIGSIGGLKSYNSKVGNNMFDAGTISVALQDIMESLIPGSRKVSSKYTNTMIVVNKVWLDSTTNAMAPPSLEMKGGKSVTYRSRLVLLLGGQLKASIKRLTATSKGINYNWGVQTKIKVLKNQLPSPFDLTYEGEFICTGFGIIGTDKEEQDEYKKNKVPLIIARINGTESKITSEEISFSEEDGELE